MNVFGQHYTPRRLWFSAHRYMGVIVAVFVTVLALTGLMLNHTSALGLDQRFVGSEWLLEHYHITAPEDIRSYHADPNWVSQWGHQLYLDDVYLGSSSHALRGALKTDDLIVLATSAEVWLLTTEGELVERLGSEHGLPTQVVRIGTANNGEIVIDSARGVFSADLNSLQWQSHSVAEVSWSTHVALADQLRAGILDTYRSRQLSWERVLLDVHSGRVLGAAGELIMDGAAILLLLLAASGTWLFISRPARARKRDKSRGPQPSETQHSTASCKVSI
jgi:hypothetical protein